MPADRSVYDYPQYWDLAFRDETRSEADFIAAAAQKYGLGECRRVLEPGCGGGRLVVELAARGYDVVAYDLSDAAIGYLRRRLRRRGLGAELHVADMVEFATEAPVDLAICPVNTFRHLLSEEEARRHLERTAQSVRPGGLYILGLHLLPPDAAEEDSERWTAQHGRTRVTVTLRVKEFDRARRREVLRFHLRVRSGSRDLKLVSEFPYRIYTASQLCALLASVPQWELRDVYDFWYDIDEPLPLNDDRGDTVLVLQRV